MKYIRTKDGRIYATDNIRKKEGCVVYYPIKGSGVGFEDREIINQADTIEELCDEFVLCEDNHYCVVSDVEAKEMATSNYGTIYGAIWTDKGLIYVAKMNNKGELELL